jgi:hypothetical protein
VDKVGELLRLEGIASEDKVEVLTRHVQRTAQLPPGCEQVWQESLSLRAGASSNSTGEPVLPRLLARLDLKTLEQFYVNTASQHADAFLAALLVAYRENRLTRSALAQIMNLTSDEAILALYRGQGPEFFRVYPRDETVLGSRLQGMLYSLAEHLDQFRSRLDLVLAGAALLPKDEDREVADAWAACRAAVLDVGRLQDERQGVLRQRPIKGLEAACQRMANALAQALAWQNPEDDPAGTVRQHCLQRIGQQLLDGRPLLPRDGWQHEALWQKIAWRFEKGQWSVVPLARLRPKTRKIHPMWPILGGTATAFLLLAIFSIFSGWRQPKPEAQVVRKSQTAVKPSGPKASTKPQAPKPSTESRRPPSAKPTRTQPTAPSEPDEEFAAKPTYVDQSPRPDPEASRMPGSQEPAHPEATRPQPPAEDDPFAMVEKADPKVASPPSSAEDSPEMEAEKTETAEDWAGRAEQFAREHGGKFFDGVTLEDLRFDAPPDAIPPLAGSLFLGPGRLLGEGGVYAFGEEPTQGGPTRRHAIPKLAQTLGLGSVWVELVSSPEAVTIVVRGEVGDEKSKPEDGDQQRKKITERRQMLNAWVRQYEKAATQEIRDRAYEQLLTLLKSRLPAVPPEPALDAKANEAQKKAYQEARKAYDERLIEYNKFLQNIASYAREEVKQLTDELGKMDDDQRKAVINARKGRDASLEKLKRFCQQMSVVVYRETKTAVPPTKPESGNGQEPVSDSSPSPAPIVSPDKPAPPSEPIVSRLPRVKGDFVVNPAVAINLKPEAMAEVCLSVVGTPSRLLPAEFSKNFVAGCSLVLLGDKGFVRRMESNDISVEKTHDVLRGTASIRMQIKFYRLSSDPFAPDQEAVAESEWKVIQPVEERRRYTVMFELGKEGLETLKTLLKKE